MGYVVDPDSISLVTRIYLGVFVIPRLISSVDCISDTIGVVEPLVLLLHIDIPTGSLHPVTSEYPVRVQICVPERPNRRNNKQQWPDALKLNARFDVHRTKYAV